MNAESFKETARAVQAADGQMAEEFGKLAGTYAQALQSYVRCENALREIIANQSTLIAELSQQLSQYIDELIELRNFKKGVLAEQDAIVRQK